MNLWHGGWVNARIFIDPIPLLRDALNPSAQSRTLDLHSDRS